MPNGAVGVAAVAVNEWRRIRALPEVGADSRFMSHLSFLGWSCRY